MNNLNEFEKKLISEAKEVSQNSYSPYSKFPVGCALVDENGNVYRGCNVENASYGLSVCAERNAVFSAITQVGPGLKVKLVVIYTPTEKPTTPCGACRQVLQEFADSLKIICACKTDKVFIGSLNDIFKNPPKIEQ